MIRLDEEFVRNFVTEEQLARLQPLAAFAHQQLWDKELDAFGKGWMEWPVEDHTELYNKVDAVANKFRANSDVTVVIGIGGSYLGAKSALALTSSAFPAPEDVNRVVFAGHQLSGRYLTQLLEMLNTKEVSVVVVSKSGGTLEPSAAFHVLRNYLEERYGDDAKNRICAITDPEKGVLREFALSKGYEILPVPLTIGGRYSVLSAVGLLPMALSGVDYKKVMDGAKQSYNIFKNPSVLGNFAYRYALVRHVLYQQGFNIEALITYEPAAADFAGWWQQLFGESQGKDGIGLYPTMMQYSTDLHSMGQYVQDARKLLLETVLDVRLTDGVADVKVPGNLDTASAYMEGKSFQELQDVAVESVMIAHSKAGVPNLKLTALGTPEELYGELVVFFEIACAFGGYLLGINPFDQPGVEAYKNEMKSRLR